MEDYTTQEEKYSTEEVHEIILETFENFDELDEKAPYGRLKWILGIGGIYFLDKGADAVISWYGNIKDDDSSDNKQSFIGSPYGNMTTGFVGAGIVMWGILITLALCCRKNKRQERIEEVTQETISRYQCKRRDTVRNLRTEEYDDKRENIRLQVI